MEEPSLHLRSLLRISTLLQAAREMYAARGTQAGAAFQQHLLTLIQDLVPFDEGVLFLYEDGGGAPPPLAGQVLEQKAPVFEESQLAVPLLLRENIAGVIHLQRTESFQDADFQMITAV